MSRTSKALVLLALPAALWLAPRPTASPPGPPPPNVWNREPVLVWDLTGPIKPPDKGTTHCHLAVYSDGMVSMTDAPAYGGTTSNRARAKICFVDLEVVAALRSDLRGAGANVLLDQPVGLVDGPMASLTFVTGKGHDRDAHTFNYFTTEDTPYEAVDLVVRDFMHDQFPGF